MRPFPSTRPVLLGVLAVVLALGSAPAAPAAARQTSAAGGGGSLTAVAVVAPPVAARFGRGRGVFRPRTTRPRTGPAFRPRTSRRSPSLRRIGGGVLRFLGLAYLFNVLFGWGPGGGSPLGLLMVLGVIAWLVTRRRRRVVYTPRY